MIGTTGVGKPKSRGGWRGCEAPFIKVGRRVHRVGTWDGHVESMCGTCRARRRDGAGGEAGGGPREAGQADEERILDLLLPPRRRRTSRHRGHTMRSRRSGTVRSCATSCAPAARSQAGRDEVREKSLRRSRSSRVVGRGSRHQRQGHVAGCSRGGRRSASCGCPRRARRSKKKRAEAIDMDSVARAAVERVQQSGIICGRDRKVRAGRRARPDVSREAASATSADHRRYDVNTNTAWCGPITSCSSRPAHSTSRSRRI